MRVDGMEWLCGLALLAGVGLMGCVAGDDGSGDAGGDGNASRDQGSAAGPVSTGNDPGNDTGDSAGTGATPTSTPSAGGDEGAGTGAAGGDPGGPMESSDPMDPGNPMMPRADAGPGDTDAGSSQDGACVVAVRLDTCCSTVVAATAMEVEGQTCLVPWSERYADPALASDCLARSPVNCAAVLCAPAQVPSHAVAVAPGGGCEFVDACQSASDCVRASNLSRCCDCGEAVPRDVAEVDPCLWIEGEAMPAGDCPPPRGCPLCGACPEPPALSCAPAMDQTVLGCR